MGEKQGETWERGNAFYSNARESCWYLLNSICIFKFGTVVMFLHQ